MKYANIKMTRQGRITVGDDVQILAIENLYRHMGIPYDEVVRIPLSSLADYDGPYAILPISFPLYGFYGKRDDTPCITCFSKRIIPVFLGVSTLTNCYNEYDVEYFKRFEPIGCRDQWTLDAMRAHGIKAYLNGCMTVTLPRVRNGSDNRHKVFCIDVPDSFIPYIPENILKDCEFVNHVFMTSEFEGASEEQARRVYQRYIDEARLIITTRMHGALPCLASGIPVILAKEVYSMRFPMIEKLTHIYQAHEFDSIDWNPKAADFEVLKTSILNLASRRLTEANEYWGPMLDISEFYELGSAEPYAASLDIDGVTNALDYLHTIHNADDEFEYILWAITQTAEMVFRGISSGFPNARCLGIIDKKIGQKCNGFNSSDKELLLEHNDALCVVCAPSAMPEARRYCEQIGHDLLYCSWHDDLPR